MNKTYNLLKYSIEGDPSQNALFRQLSRDMTFIDRNAAKKLREPDRITMVFCDHGGRTSKVLQSHKSCEQLQIVQEGVSTTCSYFLVCSERHPSIEPRRKPGMYELN